MAEKSTPSSQITIFVRNGGGPIRIESPDDPELIRNVIHEASARQADVIELTDIGGISLFVNRREVVFILVEEPQNLVEEPQNAQ